MGLTSGEAKYICHRNWIRMVGAPKGCTYEESYSDLILEFNFLLAEWCIEDYNKRWKNVVPHYLI